MSIASIYYSATRERPLTVAERSAIDDLVRRYSIEDQLEEWHRTGEGCNWESFCVYRADELTAPGVVFEGATGLPDNSEEAMWVGMQHWCRLLSEIRRVLSNATWDVHVNDHEIVWDAVSREYDPAQ